MQTAQIIFPVCVPPRHRLRQAIVQGVEAVSSIHRFLPDTPIFGVRTERFGRFESTLYGIFDAANETCGVGIDDNALFPSLTVVHEIGHVLDVLIFPRDKKYSKDFLSKWLPNLSWQQWWVAVQGSWHYQQLERTRDAKKIQADNQKQYKLCLYLLAPEELFARSYAQFIAKRSQTPNLQQELSNSPKDKDFPIQWQDNDFVAIEHALEQILRDSGVLQ